MSEAPDAGRFELLEEMRELRRWAMLQMREIIEKLIADGDYKLAGTMCCRIMQTDDGMRRGAGAGGTEGELTGQMAALSAEARERLSGAGVQSGDAERAESSEQ